MNAEPITRRQAMHRMALAVLTMVAAIWAWRLWWREAVRWRTWDAMGHPNPSRGWYGPSHAGEIAWFWPSEPPKVRIYARYRSDHLVREKHLKRYIFEIAWHPISLGRDRFTGNPLWALTRGWGRTWG